MNGKKYAAEAIGTFWLTFAGCGGAARDHIQQRRRRDGADHLRDDIGHDLRGRKTAAGREAHRHGGIEMATRHMTDRIGHRHDTESKGQRHPEKADADMRKRRGDHRAAASRKGQPERPDRLSGIFLPVHFVVPQMPIDDYK